MKIRFIIDNFISASTIMRGAMFSDKIKSLGYDCEAVSDYLSLKDSIIVFIGALKAAHDLNEEKINILKQNGNKLVLDPVDYLVWAGEDEISLYKLMDGFILNNHFTYQNLKLTSPYIAVPHTFDPRIEEFQIIKSDKLNVVYLGALYSDSYLKNPPNWLNVGFNLSGEQLYSAAIYCNIHFSHRNPSSKDFIYKPCTKLALASATNSLIFTSKDKSIMEYLPEDYPFFIDENRENTQLVYEKANSMFGTQEWTEMVKFLSSLKPKFDINNISLDYVNFFNTL